MKLGKLKRNPSVKWRVEAHREDGARTVLGDPARSHEDDGIGELGTVTLLVGGVMHQLNLLGGEVWKLCDGSHGREEIIAVLLDLFEVDHRTLEEDLDQFLGDMIERGLLGEI